MSQHVYTGNKLERSRFVCVPRCAASFQPRGPRTSGLYDEPAWQISLRARRVKNGQAAGKMPCN